MKIWTLFLALCLTFAGFHADAKRLGGGKSIGKQSSNVTQREAAPAQNVAKPVPPAPAAAPAPAPEAKKPRGRPRVTNLANDVVTEF